MASSEVIWSALTPFIDVSTECDNDNAAALLLPTTGMAMHALNGGKVAFLPTRKNCPAEELKP